MTSKIEANFQVCFHFTTFYASTLYKIERIYMRNSLHAYVSWGLQTTTIVGKLNLYLDSKEYPGNVHLCQKTNTIIEVFVENWMKDYNPWYNFDFRSP